MVKGISPFKTNFITIKFNITNIDIKLNFFDNVHFINNQSLKICTNIGSNIYILKVKDCKYTKGKFIK